MKDVWMSQSDKARAHVQEVLPRGAGNRPGATMATIRAVQRVRTDMGEHGFRRPLDLGHAIRLSAIEAGAGNCGEMCEVAFGFLKRIGASPLEMFACTKRRDHAFLVLGRPAAAQTRWIDASWRDAIICDPWDDFTSVATDDEDVIGRGVEFEVRTRWCPGGHREV